MNMDCLHLNSFSIWAIWSHLCDSFKNSSTAVTGFSVQQGCILFLGTKCMWICCSKLLWMVFSCVFYMHVAMYWSMLNAWTAHVALRWKLFSDPERSWLCKRGQRRTAALSLPLWQYAEWLLALSCAAAFQAYCRVWDLCGCAQSLDYFA